MNFWKSAKGGGGRAFLIQKFILQILGTLNRVFLSWNWYKIVISGFRVCFFNNCIEKTKKIFSFLRDGSRYQIRWIFGKVPNGSWPSPHPSEWSLSLEIMCIMHLVIIHPSIHATMSIIKKLQHNFRKWGGGVVKGRLECFRKFILFGEGILP